MDARDVSTGTAAAWRRTTAIAAVALLTSGCLFATDMDVTIGRDGSGSAVIVLKYDDDIARLIGPAAQFEREVLDAQAEGADVEIIPASELDAPFSHGLRYSASFDDPEGLRAVLLDGPFDTANVRLDGTTLTIDAQFDGDEPDDTDLFGADLLPSATARVTIEVAGAVTSSDATSSSDARHTWRYDLLQGGRMQMTAELAGGPSAGLIVAIALGVVALLGAGGVAATRSRRTSTPDVEPDAGLAAGPDAGPAAGPSTGPDAAPPVDGDLPR